MPRSRRKPVAKYHDRVAHRYDQIYDDPFWQWHDELTWGYLKPHLPADHGAEVIDLGCGTGKWGIKLAHSGYRVTCLDVSRKMLDAVERKVADAGLEDRVTCVLADLGDLSALPRDAFALATAFGEPLCSVPSTPRALKEIHGILRPDGRLVATIDNRLNAVEFFLRAGSSEALQDFMKNGRTHWLTQNTDEQFDLQTYTPNQVRRLLEQARFEVLEMVGKTVLPMRHYRTLLEDRTAFRQLMGIERKLARSADAIGRAAHVQVVGKKA